MIAGKFFRAHPNYVAGFVVWLLASHGISIFCQAASNDLETIKLEAVRKISIDEGDQIGAINSVSDFFIRADGSLFLCDWKNSHILTVSPEGKIVNSFGVSGNGPGDFNRPMRVFVVEDDILVLDSGNYRIQRFQRDGKFLKSFPAFTMLDANGKFNFNSDGSYFYSTLGYGKDHLVSRCSLEGKEIAVYGKIYGNATNVIRIVDPDVRKGIIPDSYKNRVLPIGLADGSLYVIHIAIPKIVKHDAKGNMVWVNETEIPKMKQIRDHWREANKRAPINVNYGLIYWSDVQILANGNLLLLLSGSKEIIMYELSETGEYIRRYRGDQKNIALIRAKDHELWGYDEESQVFYVYDMRRP